MTTWNATLDSIMADARKISFGKVLVTMIAAPVFAVAWVLGLTFTAFAVLFGAARVGFGHGRAAVERRLPSDD